MTAPSAEWRAKVSATHYRKKRETAARRLLDEANKAKPDEGRLLSLAFDYGTVREKELAAEKIIRRAWTERGIHPQLTWPLRDHGRWKF